jgi:hypothetical protein
MVKFPKYLLATNPDELPDQEMIVCTHKPFYAAKVMKFKQQWKAMEFMNNSEHLIKVRVPGYDVFLYFSGSIEGTRVEITPDYDAKITKVLMEMALFYLRARVTKEKYVFSKYKMDKDGKQD